MIISYKWLQSYFDKDLPKPEELGEALTMNSFEVETIKDFNGDKIFDINVLPDRSHDCLSHLGIAREVSVVCGLPLKEEFLNIKEINAPESNVLEIEVEDENLCPRFNCLVIEGVEVKDSPLWLKERLESIGQRSINSVVDVTNYIMFSIGQPIHAYDRDLLKKGEEGWKINVREAKRGERLIDLRGKEHELKEKQLVIVDGVSNDILGIAGIRGGKSSEISPKTKNIIIEAANFNPISIRKASKEIGLRTDASVRFENNISKELVSKALSQLLDLLMLTSSNAETRVEGVVDFYPKKRRPYKIGTSLSYTNNILGVNMNQDDLEKILTKINYSWEKVSPREKIIEIAKSLLGAPYKYGSSISYDSPKSFDCSSFTGYLFSNAGIAIPRMSVDQYVYGDEIEKSELKAGDLVFSNTGILKRKIDTKSIDFMKGTEVPEGVDHVGLYIGDGKVIHACEESGVICEDLEKSSGFSRTVGYRTYVELEEDRYVIIVPTERLDIRLEENLIEEIGRIFGYKNIKSKEINNKHSLKQSKNFIYSNLVKDKLVSLGFSEIYSYAFTNRGDEELLNPVASDKTFLRSNIRDLISDILDFNSKNFLLLDKKEIRVFEIGMVYPSSNEHESLVIGIRKTSASGKINEDKEVEKVLKDLGESLSIDLNKFGEIKNGIYEDSWKDILSSLPEISESKDYSNDFVDVKFQPFSEYPFVLRDLALFVPSEIETEEIVDLIKENGGELLFSVKLFDIYKPEPKDGERELVSYAFRLIFQSMEKTLTDEEVNGYMEKVLKAIETKEDWRVR